MAVVDKLLGFLGDADLVSVTLETLAMLGLDATSMDKVVDRLFANYGLLNEADIAAVVGFVLKTASDLKSVVMFERLRGKLRFEQINDEKNRLRIFEPLRDYFYISVSSVELFFAFVDKVLLDLKEGTSR